jgi:hypothetical protein
MVPCLFFGPFTMLGTLNVIFRDNVSVGQTVETSLAFSCTLLIPSSASKSNLSMAFSRASRSSFDTEHFSAIDVAFRDIRAAWVVKFSFSTPFFSTRNSLFAYFVHLYKKFSALCRASSNAKPILYCIHVVHLISIVLRLKSQSNFRNDQRLPDFIRYLL